MRGNRPETTHFTDSLVGGTIPACNTETFLGLICGWARRWAHTRINWHPLWNLAESRCWSIGCAVGRWTSLRFLGGCVVWHTSFTVTKAAQLAIRVVIIISFEWEPPLRVQRREWEIQALESWKSAKQTEAVLERANSEIHLAAYSAVTNSIKFKALMQKSWFGSTCEALNKVWAKLNVGNLLLFGKMNLYALSVCR